MKNSEIPYDSNIAINYNKDRKDEEHWEKENDFIRNFFMEKKFSSILDIPIGTGRFIQFYPKTAHVLGIDISMPMLEETKKEIERLNACNIELKIGDAENISEPRDSFDTIVCCRLFHLVDNNIRIKFLKELARVLKGELILQLYIDLPKKNIGLRILSKIIRTLRRLLIKDSATKTPWSHIKSYSLSEEDLKKIIQETELTIINRSDLCTYYGSTVTMITLRKKIDAN